jgi:hypothetical protein
MMKCAHCRSEDLRWSSTRLWELPIRIFGLRPYLCRCCRRRDWIFPGRKRVRVVFRFPALRETDYTIEPLPVPPVSPVLNREAPGSG